MAKNRRIKICINGLDIKGKKLENRSWKLKTGNQQS